jgi:glucokinase
MFTADPEMIIFGGPISKAFPFFEKFMWEKVRTFTYKHSIKKIKIVQSKQADIAILGAAALYIDGQNIEIKK